MILVTGATGFVGKALSHMLQARGIAHRLASRQELPGHFTIGAIDENTDWSQVLVGVNAIIHLAARVHVMDETERNPLAAFRRANVAASVNLARQAAQAGVRRLVFVSSIKVNGEMTANGRAFRETDTPQPAGDYGVSKLEAEEALSAVAAETGLELTIVRPPLVYGPGVKANFAALIKAVRNKLPLPLGRSSNKRSMIFVENLADLLIVCAQHEAAANAVFLAADGHDLSTREMVEKLAAAMGQKALLLPVPVAVLRALAALAGKAGAVQRLTGSLQVDITRARDQLGWVPPVGVDEAFARTVAASTS